VSNYSDPEFQNKIANFRILYFDIEACSEDGSFPNALKENDRVTQICCIVSDFVDKKISSINTGRQCCGGRKLSLNKDLKSAVTYVHRQGFRDWSCSVNWFFLFVRQLDGAVYTNKDCETSTTGRVEPLGYISQSDSIINTLRTQLETQTMPIIQCIKDLCRCGFCAPKAESKEDFMELISRNVSVDVFQK
jgi:hypothetical protein